MRRIDAFAHILPRAYLDRLERQLAQTMAPSQLILPSPGSLAFGDALGPPMEQRRGADALRLALQRITVGELDILKLLDRSEMLVDQAGIR